jgi:H+/Cl- antiporter ClcA
MPQEKLIFCVAGGTLALLFGLGVFFAARRSPLWVRWSCLFVGVVGAASGYLCFRLEFYRQSLPYRTRAYLDHYSTLLGGGALGALVVLGIYGLASFCLKRHERSNQALQPTADRSDI